MTPSAPGHLRLPADPAARFAARAARLGDLATGHAAEDWLRLLARIADGQRAAVQEVHVVPVRAHDRGPPLAFSHLHRDATWRRMLGVILAAADAPDLPVEAHEALFALSQAGAPLLEGLAERHLAAALPADRLAAAPFVGAALQAWFGALAGALDEPPPATAGAECPVCGAPPVAGVIDGTTRLRWLHCSLCGAEWNVLRLSCVSCRGDGALRHLHLEQDASAKAEACGACGGYLKLFDQQGRAGVDPVADDAATLALDVLLAQEGYQRLGASPLLATAAS